MSAMARPVSSARTVMRFFAVAKLRSTAASKRAASRFSWLNAWTMRMADSVSETIAPTSAMRSWLCRERRRTRRPKMMIGRMTAGIASTSHMVSSGAR